MVRGLFMPAGRLAFVHPGARGDIGFAADDRLDARFRGLEIEIEGAEEVAVVRHRDGRHVKVDGLFYEGVEGISPVEQAVFGVKVQMDEIGMMHRLKPGK